MMYPVRNMKVIKETEFYTYELGEANIDENNYLDLDEIMDDSDLYAQFATMYVDEQDKKSEAADDEKQKEEAAKVQDKGESKA